MKKEKNIEELKEYLETEKVEEGSFLRKAIEFDIEYQEVVKEENEKK